MTRHSPYAWQPLTMTPAEVAQTVFRRSPSWFADHAPADFPAPVDGLYAREAVEEWVRGHWGLAPAKDGRQATENRLLGRLNGASARALLR